MANILAGVERDLVLKNLKQSGRTVTIVPGFFVVSIDNCSSLSESFICFEKCPFNLLELENQPVKIYFYYQKLGLCFDTVLKNVNGRYGFSAPDIISIMENDDNFIASAFHARFVDIGVNCSFLPDYPLFTKPRVNTIDSSLFSDAKELMEYVINTSRECGKSIGNALFLIPLSKYLLEKESGFDVLENKTYPPAIIYLDEDRIVFASHTKNMFFKTGYKYNIEFGFNIEKSPVKERTVKAVVFIDQIYESFDKARACIICNFLQMKNEDKRFLTDQFIS